MALPPEALELIKHFEACMRRIGDGRYQPYLCPANVPTVGWGTTRYPNGLRVALSDTPITQARADECLAHEVAGNERAFDRHTTRRLPPLSRGAIVSFIYNCGSGAYQGSTLRRRINDARWADVPRELAKWRMAGGRILAGLVRRRAAEADLFMRGIRGAAEDIEPVRTLSAPPPKEAPPDRQPTWWSRFLGWLRS